MNQKYTSLEIVKSLKDIKNEITSNALCSLDINIVDLLDNMSSSELKGLVGKINTFILDNKLNYPKLKLSNVTMK
jgi:hypothetical protein